MPRRREVTKREILPDPKYNNRLVARFINNLLKRGKKSVAESILYGAFDIIQDRVKEPPVDVFEKAVSNVKPVIEVKSRRVGGSTYQVPTEVIPSRRVALGIRWLITHARERSEKDHARETGGGTDRRGEQSRCGHQEEGSRTQDGRGQQSICPLPILTNHSKRKEVGDGEEKI